MTPNVWLAEKKNTNEWKKRKIKILSHVKYIKSRTFHISVNHLIHEYIAYKTWKFAIIVISQKNKKNVAMLLTQMMMHAIKSTHKQKISM